MSFASLSTEVIQEVGKYCDGQQLASLAQVNRHFYAIFNPLLYKHSIANDSPSQECVRWAIEYGELNTLKYAISQGADINGSCAITERYVHSGMSSTPLHVATANSFHEMVQWLLDNGASLHEPSFGLCGCDQWGTYNSGLFWYPLHFAIIHSDEAMLRLFLQKGAYFSADRVPGLRCAIQNERLDIIDLLVQQPSFDPRYQDPHEQNALHYVCNVQDPSAAYQIVHRLVDHGVPMNVMVQGDTPLSQLVCRAMYKPAIALLERGADPYIDGHNQRMHLLDLCFNDRLIYPSEPESVTTELREDRRKLVAMFIAKGADVNRVTTIGDEYRTPLFRALISGKDVECIRILLDAGASIRNAVTDTDGSKTEGLLRELFRQVAGLFPYVTRMGGPKEAYFEPYKDSVRLLLENGARIDSVDDEESALGICWKMATPKIGTWALEFLIDNSTRQNVTLEFVEALLEKTENEEVRELLERLQDKLAGDGENDDAETADE
ncbi:uncharacterized protein NECHADRAFT_77496 [Fusarium vanettenii 77-13-4]|uniref:Uncharacterized protein n=1 Tax=Fusarium vanettenii (strain ATCC MYA-4622 / CBS 123669 / FGSC 9596 / NRRL 45880 / 77-13-4) TaxID=660122 RepID=C7YLE0_FUSV7|nr:uncharacterized protein NECHADRAFT_77496 [Fusarium vanettenii 77-13-4]EEU47244.1 hypothetical protein NECHADRAFT_77496 [Fusarium vanettenii 77-13-4]